MNSKHRMTLTAISPAPVMASTSQRYPIAPARMPNANAHTYEVMAFILIKGVSAGGGRVLKSAGEDYTVIINV